MGGSRCVNTTPPGCSSLSKAGRRGVMNKNEVSSAVLWFGADPCCHPEIPNPLPPIRSQNSWFGGRQGFVPPPSKPGDKACAGYNRGSCSNNLTHPSDLHVCSFCLRTAQKLCRHPEHKCRQKLGPQNGDRGGGGL